MASKKVLQDHKRRGKTFIPPFTHMLGPLHEISWVKTMLPELLWIALIQDYHGYREGVALITSLTRAARKCSPSGRQRIFATISSFGELTADEQSCLQSELAVLGELFEIQKALLPLIAYYPECPLRFLYSSKPNHAVESEQDLNRFKTLLEGLYNKTSKDTMMVQATAIWLAFDSGVLKVFKGLALASFPEIEKYPNTELSQKVAASIRSSIYMFFGGGTHYPVSSAWPQYFWNRGIEIAPCYFQDASSE
jgi:hypothetical protein